MQKARPSLAQCPQRGAPLVLFGRGAVTNVKDNPWFPTPNPTLAKLTADLDKLASLEETLKTKGTIAGGECRDARKVVRKDLRLLCQYVGQIADENPDHDEAIILSAGFTVARVGRRTKPPIEAKQDKQSSAVLLTARAVRGARLYYWQVSVDGQTWTDLGDTPISKMTKTGLAPHTLYYFRVRARTRTGITEYVGPTKLFVE